MLCTPTDGGMEKEGDAETSHGQVAQRSIPEEEWPCPYSAIVNTNTQAS